jgi:uncharacterized protein with HEPN domain
MPKRDQLLLVSDIRTALGRVMEYTRGKTIESFLEDQKTMDAVTRNLEIIGEAARQLDAEQHAAYPDIPWQQIIGLRHRIVHDYFGIDTQLIWEIASRDAPELLRKLGQE